MFALENKITPSVWTIAAHDGIWVNQHLMKDCGLVPYMFHKVYGFRPAMLGRSIGEYRYLEQMPEMRMEFLSVKAEEYHDESIRFLQHHYNEMDLIVLHGPYQHYSLFLSEYKKLRPDGKVYMALDMNSFWADRIICTDPWFIKLLDECDVIATSCRKIQDLLNRKWSRWTIRHIPNGFYNITGQPLSVSPELKENILLTVGRIGTEQKATHLLMEAFAIAHTELKDWRLHLVGSISEDFHPYIHQYFQRFPELREKVSFMGMIEDKAELYAEYAKSKVFVLTSFYEGGAPNVVAEALFHGCYTVTSDIDAAEEITNSGRCGRVFPLGDARALANILMKICPNAALFSDTFPKTLEYAHLRFDWEKNIRYLHRLLFEEYSQPI
ncbi:MAG: glycosyltransferase [Eubacterium sp.]|nr:glycosyltransferase [Eubacterium sp.]